MQRLLSFYFICGFSAVLLTAVLSPAQEPAPPAAQPPVAAEPGAEPAAPAPEGAPAEGGPEQPATEQPAAPAGEAAVPADAPVAPPKAIDKWNDAHSILRFKMPTISWIKLFLIFLLFVMWVKSADWVNRDSQMFDMGYGTWNPILFFPFLIVLLIFTFPVIVGFNFFIVSSILLAVCYLATFVPYVLIRNKAVQLHQKVFTPDWFRYELSLLAGKVGIKVEGERKADYEKGAPVDLKAIGAPEERDNQANLISARQSPGYLLVKELVAEMVDRRSDRALLDYTQQAVVAKQHIDGVWHNSEARDRESGDVMLAVMKTLANMNASERRKKQEGKFAAKYKDINFICPLVSQGVPTGERVVVKLLGGYQKAFRTYEDLGMRAKLSEQWSALMGQDKGLLIMAAMPEAGLTTLMDVSIGETDRLLRDFVAIEEENHRERELENVEVTTYSAATGQTAASLIPGLIRKYPNVYVLRDFSDTEAAKLLIDQAREEDRLVITGAHAKEAPAALLRMLQLKVPQRDFAAAVSAVLCMRLIRKLCDSCKVAYTPAPELLKKLGIPAGKIEALYRVPKAEEIEKPCQECGGIGFKGRTGLFELLVVDDKIREILVKQPQLDLLRKAARVTGMRSFQEEGLLLVAKGVTSIAELQRVLKE
jgi:type II secretory ATPase GspE/PulE/Tfp pilus assembly ATPase PilB-like protein